VGFLKGKSAIAIAMNYMGSRKNFTDQNFWARGYYVSTVGLNEEIIKRYIREQEVEDQRLDQLELLKNQ
jgi:putative transposase